MDTKSACNYIEQKLAESLPDDLYYHGLHHTYDVIRALNRIADNEGITDDGQRQLLVTAAYYHDAGFLNTYQNHEEEGCKIAQAVLPRYGYSAEDIALISELIMATRIPQSPKSQLAKILCDADLDYLGRPDFEEIAATLFDELSARGMVKNLEEWNQIQINFLTNHEYWTYTSILLRGEHKRINLENRLRF